MTQFWDRADSWIIIIIIILSIEFVELVTAKPESLLVDIVFFEFFFSNFSSNFEFVIV